MVQPVVDLCKDFGGKWGGSPDCQIHECVHAFENGSHSASGLINEKHEVVKPLRGSGHKPGINSDSFTRHDLVQKVCMVLEIHRAGAAPAMEFGGKADALVKIVTGMIEDGYVPAHIHVAVCVGPFFRHNEAQARGIELQNLFCNQRGRLQKLFGNDASTRRADGDGVA